MLVLKLKWLNHSPKSPSGVSWGVPWGRGSLKREDTVTLIDEDGKKTPIQSWPMAYWPDGSVKWTGHSAIFHPNDGSYELKVGETQNPDIPLQVIDSENQIKVDTGELQWIINKKGTHFIEKIVSGSKMLGEKGRLISIQEVRDETSEVKTIQEIPLESKIKHAEIEQHGPLRCVIKIEGEYASISNHHKRSWLPFHLRIYFYSGTSSIKMVHTFFYDGDPQTDFIKGLGMEFSIPLKGEPWNRHIRFAGDAGIYSEPAQLLLTRRHRNADGLYEKQINGEMINLSEQKYEDLLDHVKQNAIWNDFKLTQDSADHYRIAKRTKSGYSWVESTHGTRSKGLIYAGGENGGIGIGVKNFWQKFPSTLEVTGLNKTTTKLKVWFWSPDCEAMDLRHYSNDTHVVSAYEGFDEMRATPYGIANSSEIFLQCYINAPSHEELIEKTEEWQSPILLVCDPAYYYETKALGIWSLPDTSHPIKAQLESELDKAIDFYKREIEQRRWYGFWNYGDVMHTYDPIRHQWRYDLGGFAWQNTELVPNIWLWYAFLRSGREDIFKMAEAMTRHTSEVDVYHFGEYAGLGSRHNVVHWGCGCKEARISMAGLHKFYYFLTTDERTRDLLIEVKDAELALSNLDPMREFYPDDHYKTHVRVGPDWSAFCSNWLSEWERTGNIDYRNKIVKGIETFKQLPLRLLSGPTFGYNPETNELYHMGDGNEGGYHMIIAFGGPQAWMELAQLLEDEEWEDMLAEFGEFYELSQEEKLKRSNGKLHNKLFNNRMLAAGIVAYAAAKKQSPSIAAKAWNLLLNEDISQVKLPLEENEVQAWRKITEVPTITTNTTSQWCLNTMIALELIGDYLISDESLYKNNELKQLT
ncbi:exo-rhamnogalacturonan lyase family protein [Metabacillus sp. Hm71]|uniref:exo-rhamnogalacturonan lyase family protein n=1 Tax=Metabacillus sp. Hm71 TaxID=3450743 RepID=UPI003F43D8D1